ncbi:GTPase [Calderihabitans maritimus]|uniref:GTPase n=1 Tax=Calderihabitans maritimus TaxID=1246530 RepID=A0A1Z5HVF5_9FIRM|nr:methylmalonyl Co-A mutase-associated GTPase MeaB [Calderihabitans maritimus]GAW93311.1 GTPase [Calderihabitans maritimus]
MNLVEEVLAGHRRAIAKAITLVENGAESKESLLGQLYAYTGKAYVIGVTGSPGAGKSSLVDQFTGELRKRGLTVGVIAVDPTSPFSGGALLGDRIRMQSHVLDDGVFIRSMGTRGSLGGLSRATKEAIKILDAAGKDIILVETVGVGQSELDIMNAADTTIVVLTPGAGDIIQTLKAGIMEIADIFVVNKADLEGAQRTITEVESMLDLDNDPEWRPPVVPVISLYGKGIRELYDAVQSHRKYLEESGKLRELRENRMRSEVIEIVLEELKKLITERFKVAGEFEDLLSQVVERKVDPYAASRKILREITQRTSSLTGSV